jgi:tyrosine-protein phosphatase SIW14
MPLIKKEHGMRAILTGVALVLIVTAGFGHTTVRADSLLPSAGPTLTEEKFDNVIAGLPDNFYRVTPNLYRSSQPSSEQMHALEKAGIRTVLNLRQWHSDNNEARGISLILYHVGINTAAFHEEEIVEALSILHQAIKPILVHCWHGSDRTAMIVALYRLIFDNTSRSDALAELRHPRHGYHKAFYPDIARYIETVNIDVLRQRVLNYSR